ncbi:family 43 glycosylhydrolase [Echinicola sp. CAU 1574]|uniref:Family 43 glycosylhydrolase n=1 Tax=Echinicola arenosa TaxID=2774144 RepID=A0ABR9AIP1_9BACT|nr:family 43 glycosylhydrolase [Echinicola arenosa]MBD8488166.1 family 43 glycosylhydrolase [Echinicola arenosa]
MKNLLNLSCFLACALWIGTGCSTPPQNTEAYLFTYFTGNGPGEESVHYAISKDGFDFRALNNNQPVISADTISTRGGVRDPHILRGEDGSFYMVLTDLYVPEDGWTNQGMVFLKSDDLIHWAHSTIQIPEVFPAEFGDVKRVWAPQTFYDQDAGKYMVYFSMLQEGGHDIIYYAYANEDFTGLETTPKQLFFHPEGKSCIDGDIIFHEGKYHLFFKTEGHGNGIKKAVSDQLTTGYVMEDRYLQQTEEAVEGSGIFKLNGTDNYILMYDVYMKGAYQFTESTDLENFRIIDDQVKMNFHPRHGTVLPITMEEVNRLVEAYGIDDQNWILSTNSEQIYGNNVMLDQQLGTIYLPLKEGADLGQLDPQFEMFSGFEISPSGPQDFNNGSVDYTLTMPDETEKVFQVVARKDNNPALKGYYADPEIIYSDKTGKFHLYPTSDGFTGWSGTYFKSFSSKDLTNWQDDGVILDLTKDVAWTSRNAWAPCAIEKKIDGEYKYFYYFTAGQKVGVAVANDPAGPFEDLGKPLVDFRPEGVRGGQEIDPDVFTDPRTGKDYLYWGNGYLAAVPLNEDMVSFDKSKLKVLTPDNTFREGTEVFFRNGKYYFLWSENDTRDEDYRVRYAFADSPMGPLTIPDNNLVIAKAPDQGIYGTGHNSVIQVPGKDEWYIIYHRFTRPHGIAMGRAAGYHREVCIDPLTFDAEGNIIPVEPSVEGVKGIQ